MQGRRQLLQSGEAHEMRSPAARDSALRSRGSGGMQNFFLGGGGVSGYLRSILARPGPLC